MNTKEINNALDLLNAHWTHYIEYRREYGETDHATELQLAYYNGLKSMLEQVTKCNIYISDNGHKALCYKLTGGAICFH